MKTKIVYVLVSDSDDYYLEQALLSAYSLKLHNPTVHIELVIDDITANCLNNRLLMISKYFNEISIKQTPTKFDKKKRSRYLKTNLRNLVSGDFLFIDTDTIITGDLSFVDNYTFDVGAVLDKHIPINQHPFNKAIRDSAKKVGWVIPNNGYYFNSGVMYVKDSELAHKLYELWYQNWERGKDEWGLDIDQPALAKADSELGYLISKIDDRLNCQLMENGLPYFNDAFIIHYFASNIGLVWDSAYLFRDIAIYQQLRENGFTEFIKSNIKNAKSAFNKKCLIIAGNQYDNYNTTLVRYAVTVSEKHPRINWILNKTVDIVKRFTFK